jgi:core binding factor beta subunit
MLEAYPLATDKCIGKANMDDLVLRLSQKQQKIEASLRPERTLKELKASVERDYVHVKFTETRGGTELGVRLDRQACNFANANFDSGEGSLHIEGDLSLNYVKVRCVCDIDLATLDGIGRLIILENDKT